MDTGEFEAELANDKAVVARNQEEASEVKTEITRRESRFNLNDIYRETFLRGQEAAGVKIGGDARDLLDARPGYAVRAKVSHISPEAQFTPKRVETRSERGLAGVIRYSPLGGRTVQAG
jgi:hypothetical protein